ncbi:MAG TPA: nitrous oxide reductase accessory protein NosL [Nitrospirota bacterium]|nr:nitrous oxide reductase accessory protein NosL [Nitrospirota bacterium]
MIKKISSLAIVFSSVLIIAAVPASRQADIRDHPTCPICNMDRQEYAHSRMLIRQKEGDAGTCSIHCTAAHIAVNRDKRIIEILVADYGSRHLIRAKTAFWVIGGDRGGVMTLRAKWAFANESDAAAFIRDHGGRQATYDEALKATFEDMYTDIKAVRQRSIERKTRQESSPLPQDRP